MAVLALALGLALQAGEEIPLKPGTTWSYRMSTGQTLDLRVAGTSVVGAVPCTIVETRIGTQTTREHVALTAQGLTAYKVENAFGALEYPTPILRVRLPFKSGETWTVQLQENGTLNTYGYRTDGPESLTVLGSTVEAWKVATTLRLPQGEAVSTLWYAKGLGMVRQVYEVGGQKMTAELASTSLQPAAAPAGPRRCGKCGAEDKAGGKFCAECAAPFGMSTPAPAGAFVRYESKDGKVLLYHPAGWKVQEGEQFGPGTYTVAVEEADESAGLLFMTFALDPAVQDSVAVAGTVLSNLSRSFPDLRVDAMRSGKDRARTTADVALTMEGRKVVGRFHFFHSGRAGTVYGLFARQEKWEAARPILAQVSANLAYAPEGVAQVLRQGRRESPRPEGQSLSPVWILKDAATRAAKGEGAEVPLQPVQAQDGSFSMAVPRGWIFQGAKLQATAGSDDRYVHGYSSTSYTIFVPGGFATQTPGMLVSGYLPPAQALDFLLRTSGTGTDLKLLSAATLTDVDPSLAKAWQPALAAGAQVDNRLLHAEFTNAKSGTRCRGVFSITCTAWPLGTAWTCMVEASWAPAEEYEKWAPVYVRMSQSSKQNQGWLAQDTANQAAESARLNRNLVNSIGELNRSYERYNQSWWDSQASKDYTSWAWSRTTLGQGSWVSEREGAQVIRADAWGLENTRTGEQTRAWNHTSFTGRNPWSGEQLDEVDTRAEYDRFLRGR